MLIANAVKRSEEPGLHPRSPGFSFNGNRGMAPVRHLGVMMVRCPITGRELSTGVQMDARTFEQLPETRTQLTCPICKIDHVWSTREAWFDNPPPSVPEIAWLFLNNRVAEND